MKFFQIYKSIFSKNKIIKDLFFSSVLVLFSVSASSSIVFQSEKRYPSSYKGIDGYINKLQSLKRSLKTDEFDFILLEQGICVPLEQLKEDTKLSKEDKDKFLKEILKTYVQILNHTGGQNLFYCLYYYFSSSESEQSISKNKHLLSLLNQSVSKSKKEHILYYLTMSEREEKEGNGNLIELVPRSDGFVQPLDFSLSYGGIEISKQQTFSQSFKGIYTDFERDIQTGFNIAVYKEMISSRRKKHSNELRKIYVDFEAKLRKTQPPAGQQKINRMFWNLIINQAFASIPQCLIGGVPRHRVGGKCPTTKNSCDIDGDGKVDKNTFKCGEIFNSHCVPRRYRGNLDISNRCFEASKEEPMFPSQFRRYINTTHKKVQQICTSKTLYREACTNYNQRLKALEQRSYNTLGDLHQLVKKCLIGGVLRSRVGGKCPTTKNSCDIDGDGKVDRNTFKCGLVFNEVCIYRRYKGKLDISDRCFKASKRKFITPEQYGTHMDKTHKSVMELCEEDQQTDKRSYKEACGNYNRRMHALKQKYGDKPSSLTDTQTEARALCSECSTGGKSLLDPLPLSAVAADELEGTMKQILMDSVHKTASCKCDPHDGCKRGCKKLDGGERGKLDSLLIKCTGDKPENQFTRKCMANVRGALMKTIDEFIPELCGDKMVSDRDLCLKQQNSPNICNSGFKFRSALCGLALVDPELLNNEHISEGVRRRCRSDYNAKLAHFEGTPLFTKEKVPDKFSEIPEGAVIIGRLRAGSREHGHIEIKTDRQCSRRGKTSSCFCSDFCTSRTDQITKTYDPDYPLVVMKWNPDFIKLIAEKQNKSAFYLLPVTDDSMRGNWQAQKQLLPRVHLKDLCLNANLI